MPNLEHAPIMVQIDALPPLPESVARLETLFAQGDPEPKEIVAVIEEDPALTTDILAAANSAFYGFKKGIVTVHQALMLLGNARIRTMALDFATKRAFDADLSPYGLTTAEFARICKMQSELAFHWLMGENPRKANTLIPLAFLAETGKLVIANELKRIGEEEAFAEDLQKMRVEAAELIHVGMTTTQIDALIFKRWKLHESFVEVTHWLDAETAPPATIADEVAMLRIIRTAVGIRNPLGEISIQKALDLAEKAGYDSKRLLYGIQWLRERQEQ